MTDKLPPQLLALFAPRPPLRYLLPADTAPENRKTTQISGIAKFLSEIPNHDKNYIPTDTAEQKKDKRRAEKAAYFKKSLRDGIDKYDPGNDPQARGDPYCTLFVSRLPFEATEHDLEKDFSRFGPIERIRLVRDKENNKPKGYAFIVFEHERDMKNAYKEANGMKIRDRRILVDVERGRTVRGWRPRRLGGGMGGRGYTKEQLSSRFGFEGGGRGDREDYRRSSRGGFGGDRGDRGDRDRGDRGDRGEFRGGRGGYRGGYSDRGGGGGGDRGGFRGGRGGGSGPPSFRNERGGRYGGIGYRGGFSGNGQTGPPSGPGSAPTGAPTGPSSGGFGGGGYQQSSYGSGTNNIPVKAAVNATPGFVPAKADGSDHRAGYDDSRRKYDERGDRDHHRHRDRDSERDGDRRTSHRREHDDGNRRREYDDRDSRSPKRRRY